MTATKDLQITALLPVAPELALDAFGHRAAEVGFEVIARPDGLLVPMVGGDLHVTP
ncbi:hypothetical protein HOY34_17405 [Xinfangfangia sp. D13-10-4-6]|uniref:hypothetical protein n=1 Tax=Pseudogemmobacter hezensis TaxID=2737662 RepID=UPI001555E23F|nr:hypothetical protein [Pseudogemmobacter hezensis]NPD16972.1 hypothetical protein [Pseudogemmobacter hezensis]